MVARERGGIPLIMLRPAIIESSFGEPYPGWIQGSRMADPIIMAFAKGIIREFPGDPESLIDIVPVDHVVNAILAAAVRRPEEPEVFQVASGDRNPLRYRQLYEHVREYFLRTPAGLGGRPIQPPSGAFPAAGPWSAGSRRSSPASTSRARSSRACRRVTSPRTCAAGSRAPTSAPG